MDSLTDRVLEHVKLSVQIGCQPIGSSANLAAAEYIGEVFQSCGHSLERQEIPCPDWVAEKTSLKLDGELLDALVNTFSPSCDISTGIEPVITPLAGSSEFEALIDMKLTRYPGVMKVEPWPASDHYISYSNGTPGIALIGKGIRDTFHTLFEELDNQDLSWSRPQS